MSNGFYKDLVNEEVRIFPEVKPIQLFKLPIVIPTKQQQSELEKVINQIFMAKKFDPKADTSALETECDQLVYQLYGLTEAEIKIVEGVNDGK